MNTEQPIPVTDDNAEPVRVAPGTILKLKREELGLTQKQVADRLRLRVALIKQIEENQFEADQVATFTRGYLRSYAKVVGVNESEILSSLDEAMGSQPPQVQNMKSFSRKTNREKHDNRIMMLTWGIVAVIVAISSVWWYQNQQKNVIELTTDESVTTTESTPSVPDLDAFETLNAPAEESSTTNTERPLADDAVASADAPIETPVLDTAVTEAVGDDSTVAPTDAEVKTAEVAEPKMVEITKPAEDISNRLVMKFSDECWVQVKDATGKTLVSGIKGAGETATFDGKKPYNIILGAPENVSITLASEPVDLSGYTAGKAARFTLPR